MKIKAITEQFPRYLVVAAMTDITSDDWRVLRSGRPVNVSDKDAQIMIKRGWCTQVEEPGAIEEAEDNG